MLSTYCWLYAQTASGCCIPLSLKFFIKSYCTSITDEFRFAMFVPTVLIHALVSVCLVVSGFRVFLHQIHHNNGLQEAEQHQTKNSQAVDRWGEQCSQLVGQWSRPLMATRENAYLRHFCIGFAFLTQNYPLQFNKKSAMTWSSY